jgi:hypothetical protein
MSAGILPAFITLNVIAHKAGALAFHPEIGQMNA